VKFLRTFFKIVYFLILGALGIQLSARIVDTPCNEMHVDGFIDEAKAIGQALGIKPLVIQGNRKRFSKQKHSGRFLKFLKIIEIPWLMQDNDLPFCDISELQAVEYEINENY
jgi:hypothetical protein